MEECIKKEYISFIQKQLAEMAKTVKKNSSKNQAKRENNIFFIFSDLFFCFILKSFPQTINKLWKTFLLIFFKSNR